MKTLQKFGLETPPEAIDAFEGISAAEMLTAARGLAAMSAHHGTNRDSWVRVSHALAAMAWERELADLRPTVTPTVPSSSAANPDEVGNEWRRRAAALVDLSASRPWDASSSDVRCVFPSSHQSFKSDIGQRRLAVLAVCLRHVVDTGDGELSMFLGDCLQHLPESETYVAKLIEVDAAIVNGNLAQGSRLCVGSGGLEGLDVAGLYRAGHVLSPSEVAMADMLPCAAGAGGGDACGAPARAGAVPLGNTGTTAVEGQSRV